MALNSLKIAKTRRPITLWVHPEGRVTGSIFVRPEVKDNAAEAPEDVLNQDVPFLVLQKQDPDEIRFYNRSAIIRAEYTGSGATERDDSHSYTCQLLMMDGSEIKGTIHESLPPEHSRLYDYLNQKADRFIKLQSTDGITYLINKSYVTQVLSVDG